MKKNEKLYQLKIVLEDITPSIWRRFVVNSDILLQDLHKVIQTLMGWTNAHLHMFIANDTYYHGPDEDAMTKYIDYRKIRLSQVLDNKNTRIHYEYDFGDCWMHVIVLERILPIDRTLDGVRPGN